MSQINEVAAIVVPASGYLGFSDTPQTDASIIKILTGTGAPGALAAANGSIYIDITGATAALFLYLRIGGGWVPAVMT